MDAGLPVASVFCPLHEIVIEPHSPTQAHIALAEHHTAANKDFILSWRLAAERIRSGYLSTRSEKEGFVTLMLMPPNRVAPAAVAPKEMIFLVDRSGSQSGLPLEKAKETLSYILDRMSPADTFLFANFVSGSA